MSTFLHKFSNLLTVKAVTIIFLVIGLSIYGISLANPFIADDIPQILNNPLVHDLQYIPAIFSSSTFFSIQSGGSTGIYYRPLMMAIFNLFYAFFGASPFSFHLFQVSLHIANTIFIFLLLKKFLAPTLALILAVIFLIHPLNAESVIYISNLQEVLYTFFGLTALYILQFKKFEFRNQLTITLLLFLSLLSKETGLLFSGIAVLWSWIFARKLLKPISIIACVSVILYAFFRFGLAHVYFGHQEISPIVKLTLSQRLVNVPKILSYYLTQFVFPKDFALSQQWTIHSLNLTDFFGPVFFLTLLAGLYLYFYRKIGLPERKNYLFFGLWSILGMLVVSQIYPLDMTVADRWFYFPFIGLLGVLGVIAEKYQQYLSRKKEIATLVIIFIFILLAGRTIVRNFDWRDPIILYSHDTKINSNSYTLENEYGFELATRNRFAEAEVHFLKSIRLVPDWYTNWSNLGVLYFKEGNTIKAKEYLKKAIQNGDDISNLYLTTIYIFYEHDYVSAERILGSLLKQFPNNPLLWQQLALAEYGLGNKPKALEAANNAYSLLPDQKNYNLLYNLTNNVPIDLNPTQSSAK